MDDRIIDSIEATEALSNNSMVAIKDNSGVMIRYFGGMYLIAGLATDWFSYSEAFNTFGPFRVLWTPEDYNG